MLSVVITNLTSAVLDMPELYVTLGAAGSSNASITISRSVAEIDSMPDLQKKLKDAQISVVATESSDNADLLSIPLEQHGKVTGLSAAGVAVVTSAVTFAKPFPSGVYPVIGLAVDQSGSLTCKATVYARTVANTGFTVALDVTSAGAGGETVAVHWTAVY